MADDLARSQSQPQSPPAAARLRWLRILGVLAVAIPALIALFGYLVAPELARRQIESVLTRELARSTTVERVRIHPFSLEARVEGLVVAGDQLPLAKVEAIDVDASIASLWHWAPVIDALRVTRPALAFARLDAQRYDVSDLIDRAMAPAPADAKPLRYSINNIEISDGSVAFDDRPMRRRHAIDGIRIGIPFLSSLPYDAAIKVTPAVAARVNGSPFSLEGALTPFAERPEATLAVDLDRLPLPSYVDYLPFRLRYRLAAGELSTRLTVRFAQGATADHRLSASGIVTLDAPELAREDGAPLASAARIEAELAPLDVHGRSVEIARLDVTGARIALRRRADGSIELADPWMADLPQAASPEPPSASATPPVPGWRVAIARAGVTGEELLVEDASVSPAYRLRVNAFQASAESLSSEADREGKLAAAFSAEEGVTGSLEGTTTLQPFSVAGRFELKQVRLASLYPYAASVLDLAIRSGRADVAGAFTFDRKDAPGFVLRDAEGAVQDLVLNLPGEREPLWRVPRVAVKGIRLEGDARRVRVAEVRAEKPRMRLRREADGTVDFARMIKPAPADARDADAWNVLLDRFAIAGGQVDFGDRTTVPEARFAFSDVDLTLEALGNDPSIRSNARLRARASDGARLSIDGPFTISPLSLDWRTDARGVRAVALRPYVDPHTDVVLGAGVADASGRLRLTERSGSLTGGFAGRVELRDVTTTLASDGSELMRWKRLAVEDVNLKLEPFDLAVGEVGLSDFYARIIVNADGTLNLQQLGRDAPVGAQKAPSGRAARAPAGLIARAGEGTERTLRRLSDQALPFTIGGVQLERGQVDFSDRFIRPNYNANLTQVEGSISTMSPDRPGEIALRAKLDDAAPVELRGRVQPFARELTFDVAGKATGIELPPLSTYSAKYAGYGITRGTMSFEVEYEVVDRKLAAKNRLVLDQLTFGERVDSPDATKLPVLLAVSLLKDANGVIDLDLPISGTLDDPQFSVFGLIVKVVVNLLTRAATAPFALLSAAAGGGGGGGPVADHVVFAPGSASLEPAAAGVLARLAKALSARPALKLEIAGHADPRGDADALARRALDQALRAAASKGQGGDKAAAATMTPEERTRLLTVVYRETPIEDRPRNAIGMLQDVPLAEMESKLLAHFAPAPAAVAELAQARAQAAKDALVKGGVAEERIAVVQGTATAEATAGTQKAEPRRAQFALR